MATKYQMQARSSANGALYSWLSLLLDWGAAGYVTAGYPGTAQDVALTGGGLDNSSSVSNQMTISGVGLTISGVACTMTPFPITISGVPVTIAGSPVVMTF